LTCCSYDMISASRSPVRFRPASRKYMCMQMFLMRRISAPASLYTSEYCMYISGS
jgi:hypothetical protein